MSGWPGFEPAASSCADVVQFTGFYAGTPPSVGLSHFTVDGLADRVGQVHRISGDRFDELELSVFIQAARLTNDPRAAVVELIGDTPPTTEPMP